MSGNKRLTLYGFVFAFALLLLAGWMSFRNMHAMLAAGRWETHTHIVIRELGSLLSSLKDVETGQRGFIITGEQPYLEPYYQALNQVDQHLASLNRLTQDNPRQQKRLVTLEPLIRDKLNIVQRSIELRTTQGFPAAAQLIATGRGKQLMDEIRVQVARAQAEEARLLKERSAALAESSQKTIWAVGLGGLFGSALLLMIFALLKRELTRRLQADAGPPG